MENICSIGRLGTLCIGVIGFGGNIELGQAFENSLPVALLWNDEEGN